LSDAPRRKRLVIPPSALMPYGTIDAEHEALVDLINRACDVAEETQFSSERLAPIYSEIEQKFAEHFDSEEQMMELARFPGLIAHRGHHTELLRKVTEICERVRKGDFAENSDLEAFFDALINDVLLADLSFKAHLEQHGGS
jgi:hemerythrin-like metal-binding protein